MLVFVLRETVTYKHKKPLDLRGLNLYFSIINSYSSIFSKAFFTISFSLGNQP